MARYIIEEMPDLQKTGKRITYPKFARIDNTSIKELAQRVGDVSGFSAGDIEGVLLQTAIEMAHLMAYADHRKAPPAQIQRLPNGVCPIKERLHQIGGNQTYPAGLIYIQRRDRPSTGNQPIVRRKVVRVAPAYADRGFIRIGLRRRDIQRHRGRYALHMLQRRQRL